MLPEQGAAESKLALTQAHRRLGHLYAGANKASPVKPIACPYFTFPNFRFSWFQIASGLFYILGRRRKFTPHRRFDLNKKHAVRVGGRMLEVSNLQRLVYPSDALSKAHVIEYYMRMAPVLTRYIKGRPMSFVRYPDGIEGKAFFQKNAQTTRRRGYKTMHGGTRAFCCYKTKRL